MTEFRHNTLYYTAEEAASKLQCTTFRVHALIRSKKLRLVAVGKKRVIPAEDIEKLLEHDNAGTSSSPEPPSTSQPANSPVRQETYVEGQQTEEQEPAPHAREGYYYTQQQALQMLATDAFEINRLVRLGELSAVSINKYRWIAAKGLEDLVRRKYGSGKLVNAPEPVLIRKPGISENRDVRTASASLEPERPNNTPSRQAEETTSLVNEEDYYTVEEVAERLRKTKGEIWRMVFFKKLQTETIGDRKMFPKQAIDDLLRNKKNPAISRDATKTTRVEGQVSSRTAVDGSEDGAPQPSATSEETPTRNIEGYYSDAEVATKLGKDTDEIWEMVYRNQLPVVWIDGTRMFPKKPVDDILDQQEPTGAAVEESVIIDGRDGTPRSSTPPENLKVPTQDSPDADTYAAQPSSPPQKSLEERAAEHRDRLIDAAQRYGTQIKIVKKMVKAGALVLDEESGRLIPPGQVSVQSTSDNSERGTQNPPDPEAAEEPYGAPSDPAGAEEREPEQEIRMLRDALRAEKERSERLDEELKQERASHDRDLSGARYEIDRLDAEIENLRRDRAFLSETLHEDLEEERYKRIQAENIVEQLRDDLHEEIERRIEAEQASGDSDSGENLYGRLSSGVRGVVQSLKGSVSDEDEEEHVQPSDLRSQLESLKTQLEEERDNGRKKEEWAANLQTKVEQGEARVGELEKALSTERERRLRLEDEKRVLDEVRTLLGAESVRPRPPEVSADAPEPQPTAAEPDGQQLETLVLTTPYGRYAFDPPFPLSDQEVKLLRFVAREEEVTEEQIRRLKGRRALQTLNDLLDRLTDEGANPILEINDRYSFDPSILQSD